MDRRHRSAEAAAASEELVPLTATEDDTLSPRGDPTERSSVSSDLSRRPSDLSRRRPTGFEAGAGRRGSGEGGKSVRIASRPTVYGRGDGFSGSEGTVSGTE